MKNWNCQVKSKQELITDLMFNEIMNLRNEAASLSSHLIEVCEAINESGIENTYLKNKAEEAMNFRRSLK
jgi:hypothetical protein